MESWITTDIKEGNQNGNVQVTAEPNLSVFDRLGILKVSTSALEKYLTIIQKKGDVKMKHIYILLGNKSPYIVDWRSYKIGETQKISETILSNGDRPSYYGVQFVKDPNTYEAYTPEEVYQIISSGVPIYVEVVITTRVGGETNSNWTPLGGIMLPVNVAEHGENFSLSCGTVISFDAANPVHYIYQIFPQLIFSKLSSDSIKVVININVGLIAMNTKV